MSILIDRAKVSKRIQTDIYSSRSVGVILDTHICGLGHHCRELWPLCRQARLAPILPRQRHTRPLGQSRCRGRQRRGIGYGITQKLIKYGITKLYILSASHGVVKGSKEAVARDMDQATADRTVWMKSDLSDWNGVKDVSD
jgi:hypothetical protein